MLRVSFPYGDEGLRVPKAAADGKGDRN